MNAHFLTIGTSQHKQSMSDEGDVALRPDDLLWPLDEL